MKNITIVQHADTVTYTFQTWMILKFPCRNVCVMVKIMKKNSSSRKEMKEMPVPRDTTMLKPDSRKMLIAMAAAEMEPKDVSAESGVPVNIIYTMRRGFYTKPKYIGAVAKALQVKVIDLIEDKEVEVKACED